MRTEKRWEKDGFIMRSAERADAERYYSENYCPLDPEVVRFTGCKASFMREVVVSFFYKSIEDTDRYLFLILDPDGRIIGESVINEMDFDLRRANFRIAFFQASGRGRGIGTWAVERTRDFAFEELGLHRLDLDVYSFNPRAEHVYRKAGFRREGVLRDAVLDGQEYADDILMAILEEEWREIKGKL